MQYPKTYDATIALWRKKMEAEHLAPRTISFYCETMHAVAHILADANRPILPREITSSDADYLLDYFVQHSFAVQTRKGYIATLRKYTAAFQNPVSLKARFPHDTRPHADWLTSDQARALLSCPMSTVQRTVIHLELCLGLRHVEVIRLRAVDINYDEEYITVTGKGPAGGKPRIVPFTSDTAQILRDMELRRNEMIDESRKRFPVTAEVPPTLMIWSKAGRLHSYSEEGYGLDKIVTLPLSDKLGFHFSNHTLRRTFGRALFRSGVEVPVIAKILGHESTDVTLRYIGVDLDDMQKAMRRFRL